MRAVALHPDVLLVTSAIWQTNCVMVRSGEEAFLIDSPILPDELDALGTLVEQARFPEPSGLLVTHGDWDHLLGRLAFPGLSIGCAESTAERLSSSPGYAQRELRDFDEAHLIQRTRPLALGAVQTLPAPGCCEIGEHELELHPAGGHTEDGMAVWIPWAKVLVVGDYVSTVEIPVLDGSPDAYLQTVQRLRPLIEGAAHVIPGHGPVLDADRASRVVEEDIEYMRELCSKGAKAQLPVGRRGAVQRRRHARNVERMSSAND